MKIFNSWLVNKYIAHRGLHNEEYPENSMGAFANAIENDYAIELDVHKIEDNTIVVFHDETLKRLTGQDGYINQIKTIKDLKNYKLLGTNYSIPTFKEVLDFVDGRVPILIEIKDERTTSYSPTNPLTVEVYNLLKNYKGDVAIQSFNPYILQWFKINAPEVVRGQLASYFTKQSGLKFFTRVALKHMWLNKKISEPNFIAYNYKNLPNRFVKKYKRLPLLAWAVPSQQEYMKVAPHCDNIIFENFQPRI